MPCFQCPSAWEEESAGGGRSCVLERRVYQFVSVARMVVSGKWNSYDTANVMITDVVLVWAVLCCMSRQWEIVRSGVE